MSRGFSFVVLLSLLTAIGCSGPDKASTSEARGPLVNCYDEANDAVDRRFANDCNGRIISDEEAARRGSRAHLLPQTRPPRNYRIGGPRRRLVSAGSGFFINENGGLLTSFHVVADCAHISVSPAIGGSQIASVIAADVPRDLALIQVPTTPQRAAQFARSLSLPVGHEVAVVGYPGRRSLAGGPAIFNARVLGSKNAAPGLRVVGFRGPVRQGNSGGPMIDGTGHVLGVVFAKTAREPGKRDRNIGFAIPSDAVTTFLKNNGATFSLAHGRPAPLPSDLLQATKPVVAQVGCWR